MWKCLKCHEELEDSFDTCWNCGTSQDGAQDSGFQAEAPDVNTDDSESESQGIKIQCLRCHQTLDFMGTRRFKAESDWNFFGELGELFLSSTRFDFYRCPKCGKVELFVDGVGDEFRPN